MNEPFQIFPWDKPFLPAFKDYVEEVSNGHPGKSLIITPHMRPARYLTNLYRKDKKALILPKMLSINDLVSTWRAALGEEAMRMANPLDQVGLLFECIQELELDTPWTTGITALKGDIGSFLPWGLKLAKVLEDFAIENVEIKNFSNMEDELGNAPAAILSSLNAIGNLWEKKLKERAWTTIGQDHKFALAHVGELPPLLLPSPERPVIIAGFYKLTGSHNILLKSLWEAGAQICLHTDPAIMEKKEHWACREHRHWQNSWQADLVLRDLGQFPVRGESKITYFAGHDLHSQLQEMGRLLKEEKEGIGSTALIAGREENLSSVLQNLPPINVNVSMGYPMERSPLIRLFQSILRMFAKSPEDGVWLSADILEVIRHPYIQMLTSEEGESKKSYRGSLRKLEKEIVNSGIFWREAEEESLAESFMDTLKKHFNGVDTLEKMGKAIEGFCNWLLEKGKDNWSKAYAVDREVMNRMLTHIVPILKNNLLAETSFSSDILINLFEQLVREEKIPFEADPIEGLQVLGMLESRLLQFDRLILLDASDDVLPGKAAQDPLLPDSLRSLAGLPDNRDREAVTAHNLFRLMAGAKETHFLWPEGVPAGEFYDSKKNRSRFVERLIWEAEKKKPVLLDDKSALVRRPSAKLNMPVRQAKIITHNAEFERALANFLAKPINATAFDLYLKCPTQFIYSNIMQLGGSDQGLHRNAIAGKFIHKVLEKIYSTLPKGIWPDSLSEEERLELISNAFSEAAKIEKVAKLLSADDQEALAISVPPIINTYLSNPNKRVSCLQEEDKISGELVLGTQKLMFKGRLDRLDLGSDGLYIIDYKTEKEKPLNDPKLWDDEGFFAGVEKACVKQDIEAIDTYLNILKEKVNSLQLPIYLLLLAQNGKASYDSFPANAAWVPLRFDCKEQLLLSSPLNGKDDPRLKHFLQTLNLIYQHLRVMPSFPVEKQDLCKYCNYTSLCGV